MTSPFDSIAGSYAALWTDSAAGRGQREEVWRAIDVLFRPGDRVLDLGCGTGDDALHLMRGGIEVLGIDASEAMLEMARSRGVSAIGQRIEQLSVTGSFTGVLSNFGALNCVANLKPVAAALATLLPPEAPVAVCVMGRFSWQETLRFLLRLDFSKAVRRWRGRVRWRGIDVYYRSSLELRRALAPQFRLERRISIGDGDHQLYVFRRTQC